MGEGERPQRRGQRSGISRRDALVVIGGTAAGITVVASRPARAGLARGPSPGQRLELALPDASPSLAFQVIRTEDMLYLGFQFYNAKAVVKNGQTLIVPENPAAPSSMVVIFPPQHHGEECVNFSDVDGSYPPPPGRDALAGYSWLTFELPPNASIPFTSDALLNWSGLKPMLQTAPKAPTAAFSALEVPWSLWLTPPAGGTWHHSATPVTSGGRTELWHTRLGVGGVEPPFKTPLINAIWMFGYSPLAAPPADPWLMSLSPRARYDIVQLTSNVVRDGGPVQTNLLALTALGASVNLQASWPLPEDTNLSLAQWTHRASTGRDSYVRVVYRGFLYPFGHRAVLVVITDREFHTDDAGDTIAYLVQRSYVVPTERVVSYTGDLDEPYGGRANPMRTVEVKTVSTPPIDTDPSTDPGIVVGSGSNALNPQLALWVRTGGADMPFSFAATDIEGRTVDFTTPVIWLDQSYANDTFLPTIIGAYDAADASRNSPSFGGALFAFAATASGAPGTTAHNVGTYTLTGKYAANGGASFYPMLQGADPAVTVSAVKGAVVRLPGAEQLTGSSLPVPPNVTISPNYVTDGFLTGHPEVYLKVGNTVPTLTFPVNLVGGMAAPNFAVTGIARDLGPVGGDLPALVGNTFDPSAYFNVLSGSIGQLLGAIEITQIIAPSGSHGATPGTQAPHISSTWVYASDAKPPLALDAPIALDTRLGWNPAVQTSGAFQASLSNTQSSLVINAEIYTPISNPAQTTYSVHGELTNFTLVLFGSAADYIDIGFTSVTFDARTGAKPSVKPQISGVKFHPPLSFISDFEQLLGSLGGPAVDVTQAGINANYTLAIPDIGVGVFSLSNLSLSGAVNIPFDGTPVRVRFALSSQENPFQLAIYVFGGGGFFALAVGADGIEMIQVSLEFGAAVSIDLGVASGGVSIMAGIYFAQQSGQVQLTGFLRADGNLSVLGIITLSMEFYLGLSYLDPGQAYGIASVTVSVSVLFFSTSVTATYQKTIGAGSDPDFAQAIKQADWNTYCEAFA